MLQNITTISKKFSFLFPSLFIISVWVLSNTLSWFAPANTNTITRYKITERESKILGLKLAVPILIIWLIAMYGATALNFYAKTIHKAREGRGYKLLSAGIYILVFQLIASNFINIISNFHPAQRGAIRIFSIYESAFITLIAYITLSWGAWKLVQYAGLVKRSKQIAVGCLVVVALIGWLYVKTILANEYRGVAPVAGSQATYGVSDILIFTTIAPQYLIAWFAGLFAVSNVVLFQLKVKGVIYKRSFRNFAIGFSMLIGMSIFLQFLSQAVSYFAKIGLNQIVGIVYGLLVAITIGYVFIALGARKLTKLETTV